MRPLSRFGVGGALLLSWALALPASSLAQETRGRSDKAQEKQDEQRREQRQRRFRAMDTNRDGVITRAEWRGNARSFSRHDWNNDGVLSGDEIWAGGRRDVDDRADDPEWQTRADREEDPLSRSFRQADRNGDGIISRAEWRSGAESFARVDVNRDGVITRREFLGEGWETAVERDEPVGTSGENRRDRQAYQAGYDRGLAEGRQAGKEDRQRNRWDLEGQRELEQADAGYSDALGARQDYQAGYRAGFRTGYHQGFGPR